MDLHMDMTIDIKYGYNMEIMECGGNRTDQQNCGLQDAILVAIEESEFRPELGLRG